MFDKCRDGRDGGIERVGGNLNMGHRSIGKELLDIEYMAWITDLLSEVSA